MDLTSVSDTRQCLHRIHQLLEQAELFYGHGTDNAWDEACWLLEGVLRMGGSSPGNELPDSLDEQQLALLEALLKSRIEERKPLAYLLREAWFAGLPFQVDERVLIPRSPIAELIQNGFEPLLAASPTRILDLCTGSGCIGIACALAFPEALVDLSDLSGAALEIAQANIARYQLQNRVRAFESDLFDKVADSYDLIVSNPPYVSRQEYADLPAEYHQEPQIGLVSEDDGLAIPLAIIAQAAHYLSNTGILVLETGYSWQALSSKRPDIPFLWLDFEQGGEGVCMLTAAQLRQAALRPPA
ncbi:MAG: 50S ribosomal protein L3 N(5)-glutamine methyltransferase [Pseudomonadales bacterium]|nr:50S ribosomal protein L3 N(5)-glutamine methyltransferase [Pseudomonadales bacterium]